jgi:membrane-associated phospholipid phosphatase
MTLRNVVLLVALAVVGYLYLPLNRPWGRIHTVALPIDASIPFLPIFVIPYLLYIPFLYGTVLYFSLWKSKFEPVAYSFLTTWVICYLIYLTFQTKIVRPQIESYEGNPLISLVKAVYQLDRPYNCLPSLHSANSMLCLLTYYSLKRRAVYWATPLVIAIVASTVFVKQHYLIDTLAGALLAIIVFCWIERRHKDDKDKPTDCNI